MIKTKAILGAVLLLLPPTVKAEEFVSIKLNASIYTVDDEFEVVVTNTSGQFFERTWLKIEKRGGRDWLSIRRIDNCPCLTLCKEPIGALSVGESRVESWDFKDGTCNVVSAGFYRLIFAVNYVVVGTSPVFEVR